jgi:transposase
MMPTQLSLFSLPPIDAIYASEAMSVNSSYLIIGDQIEQLLAEVELARLDPSGTQTAATLATLALITVFQFVENLPDHRAAEATRTRLDWKYALHLPRTYPGLNPGLLCEFRRPLVCDPIAREVFQQLLDCLAETELLRNADGGPPAASKVLAAVCHVNRLERLMEAMRMVLEALAAIEPEQLRMITLPHWYERYGQLHTQRAWPKSWEEQAVLAQAIGTDAAYLLEAIARTAGQLTLVPEVQALQQIWPEQFDRSDHPIQWRSFACASCFSP